MIMQVLDSHSHPVSGNLGSRNAVSEDFNPPTSPEHQIFDSLLNIAQAVDCPKILQIAVQLLQTDLGVDRVVIYQRQENGQAVITAEAAKSEWQNSLGMAIADLRDLQSLAGGTAEFTTEAIHDVFETAFLDRYREVLTQQKVRSSLMIPLVIQNQEVNNQEGQNQYWGAIVMQSCAHRRGWDPLEIEHGERLASHVAIALQRALHHQQQENIIQDLQRREQTLQDKNYQLTSLASQQNFLTLQANAKLKNTVLDLQETNEILEHQTATAKVLADFILKIRQSLELDQILETTTSEIHRCLQVDRLAICRIDAHNIGTIIAESVVAPWPSTLGIEFSAELLSVKCQQELSAMPYKAVPDVEETYHDTIPQMLVMLKVWGVKAKLVVPILQKENLQGSKLWGFMIAHQCTNTRHWLPAELDLLTQVASHVAISIEQSELYRKRQQALEVMERTEQMLVVQHEQIGHILASSPGILYSSLAQGSHYQRIFFGTNLFTLLGYTSLDAIETDFWLNCIHPEDRALVQLLSDRPIISQEYRFRHKDGTYRWLYDQQKVVYDDSGSPLEWIGYCVDISNHKHIEEKLKASLSEKEILLKEIHHRVKNNLNIIISLLNLQSNYVTDDAIIDMFMDSQSRIYTMALIHEQLYGSENLARLNFADYVGDLVNHLNMSCLSSSETQIELAINIAPVALNIETATPCGLILNELVTNALKHAFLDGRSGTISISLTHHANHLQLMIQDNGVGFAPDIDWQNSPTLGLRLVRILARQLDATLTQESGATGTCFCLTLSELAYEARI
jgi:PAS domain S-box-containing protein